MVNADEAKIIQEFGTPSGFRPLRSQIIFKVFKRMNLAKNRQGNPPYRFANQSPLL